MYRDLQQLAALQAYVEALPCSGIQYIWVQGGRRRQDSVYNALKSLQISADYVFIHDCARPLIQSKTLVAMWEQLQLLRGLALAHPVVDSIKQIAQESNLETPSYHDLDRSQLWAMETPQAFIYQDIFHAYEKVVEQNVSINITDDVSAAELTRLPVYV